MKNKNVVVIGGGTGAYTVLNGIKHIPNIDITAIVSSADSGGSTGVLRDHFGQLPVGDYRQCLVALSEEGNGDSLLRELFQYRFSKGGKGLEGHNFGNLFLTALSDILGSDELAFQKASRILSIQGRVYPVTYDDIQLMAEYEDGSIGYGESYIDDPPKDHDGSMKVVKLWVGPEARISLRAQESIEKADLIIMGPGDLYTSTLANVVVEGVAKTIRKSNAKIMYITNLVSKWGQTDKFKISHYISEIERYTYDKVNYILVNNNKNIGKSADKYKGENARLVEDDLKEDTRAIRGDFLFTTEIKRKKEDKVKRSLLRHDSHKLKTAIETVINDIL